MALLFLQTCQVKAAFGAYGKEYAYTRDCAVLARVIVRPQEERTFSQDANTHSYTRRA